MGIKYSSAVSSWTPTATTDGSQLTGSGYHALRTAAATDKAKVMEVGVQGEATSSTVNVMSVRRHTTASTTPTNRVPTPLNPYSQASVFQGFITASTNPTVAALATLQHLLNISLNAFGGLARWVAAPDEELHIVGTSANNNEVSLASQSGTGVVSSHFVVEEE